MKKYILILFISIIALFSCEKDDFCTQNPVTPNLVIKFMDITDRKTIKRPEQLVVWADGKDSLYVNSSVDSIIIPLNTAQLQTVYKLSVASNNLNTLMFNYEIDNQYVSRSCGYKAVFKDVKITNTAINSWIGELSTTEIPTINNQDNAHLIIYH